MHSNCLLDLSLLCTIVTYWAETGGIGRQAGYSVIK